MCASTMLSPRTRSANSSCQRALSHSECSGMLSSRFSTAVIGVPAAIFPRIGISPRADRPAAGRSRRTSVRDARLPVTRRSSMPFRSSAFRWSKAARAVNPNRSAISRTAGGTPWLSEKVRMNSSTCRWRVVIPFTRAVLPRNRLIVRCPCALTSQHPLSTIQQEKSDAGACRVARLAGLPGLADGTGGEPGLFGLRHALEVDPLWLGDLARPPAASRVKELRPPLREVGLALVHRGLCGRLVRSERCERGIRQRRNGRRRRRLHRRRLMALARRVRLVGLEIGLDRGSELVAGALELAHGAAEGAPQLGQVLGAEDEQCDDEDENQFLKADIKHRVARSLADHTTAPGWQVPEPAL